jgi:hypothetical protein
MDEKERVAKAGRLTNDLIRKLEAEVARDRPQLNDAERHELALLRDMYSLQRDGSVIFIDRGTAPSTWVTCRRDANGRWMFNASDYGAMFIYDKHEDGVYYIDGEVVEPPDPAPDWKELDDTYEMQMLADLARLLKLEGVR